MKQKQIDNVLNTIKELIYQNTDHSNEAAMVAITIVCQSLYDDLKSASKYRDGGLIMAQTLQGKLYELAVVAVSHDTELADKLREAVVDIERYEDILANRKEQNKADE